jgi:hypothetical protein
MLALKGRFDKFSVPITAVPNGIVQWVFTFEAGAYIKRSSPQEASFSTAKIIFLLKYREGSTVHQV